jgi:hypothetical protein
MITTIAFVAVDENGLHLIGDGVRMIGIGMPIDVVKVIMNTGTGRCRPSGVQVALSRVTTAVRTPSDGKGVRTCGCRGEQPVIAGDGVDGDYDSRRVERLILTQIIHEQCTTRMVKVLNRPAKIEFSNFHFSQYYVSSKSCFVKLQVY